MTREVTHLYCCGSLSTDYKKEVCKKEGDGEVEVDEVMHFQAQVAAENTHTKNSNFIHFIARKEASLS